MRYYRNLITGLLFILLACGSATAEVITQRGNMLEWGDAYRITNGTIEMMVVPKAGRILYFGFVGGPNVLWQGDTPLTAPVRTDKWINAGGDRALPWPQSDWPDRIGRIWPPPLATEINPHQLVVLPDHSVRMISPVIPEYGVRLMRVIRMDPAKPQVEIETIMERILAGPNLAMSPWMITQCKADGATKVIARREKTSESLKTVTMLDRPWPMKREISANVSEFSLPGNVEAKAGMNAEILSVQHSGMMLTQRAVCGQAEVENPERAQIFSPIMMQDECATGNQFVEIEFIGQPKLLSVGQRTSITLIWELARQ